MNLDIVLKKGIGEIRFDTCIEEVVGLLGTPNEIEEIGEEIDQPTTVLHYDELGLSLFFEMEECSHLVCINTDSDDITIFKTEVMGKSKDEIIALMQENNVLYPIIEEEEWQETRLSFEQEDIDFFFEDDQLVSIDFGK